MFATTTTDKHDHRTRLQQALDRDAAARTPSQEFSLAGDGRFQSNADPTAPIFRRASARSRRFEVDLFAGWTRA